MPSALDPGRRDPVDRGAAAVLIPLVAAGVVFLPITRNYFLEDDFLHFFQLRDESLFSFLTMPHGGHLLGSSRVDLQACKLEYSIVSPK